MMFAASIREIESDCFKSKTNFYSRCPPKGELVSSVLGTENLILVSSFHESLRKVDRLAKTEFHDKK